MRCSQHHETVGPNGRCSVPMWAGGCPAGFCDEPAYGKPPKSEMRRDGWTGRQYRLDSRYDGYVPALACAQHGGPVVEYKMDGNQWCATLDDFIDLQESPAGFGDTEEDALADLVIALTPPTPEPGAEGE